mgnify:CR=1 FL=1
MIQLFLIKLIEKQGKINNNKSMSLLSENNAKNDEMHKQ